MPASLQLCHDWQAAQSRLLPCGMVTSTLVLLHSSCWPSSCWPCSAKHCQFHLPADCDGGHTLSNSHYCGLRGHCPMAEGSSKEQEPPGNKPSVLSSNPLLPPAFMIGPLLVLHLSWHRMPSTCCRPSWWLLPCTSWHHWRRELLPEAAYYSLLQAKSAMSCRS